MPEDKRTEDQIHARTTPQPGSDELHHKTDLPADDSLTTDADTNSEAGEQSSDHDIHIINIEAASELPTEHEITVESVKKLLDQKAKERAQQLQTHHDPKTEAAGADDAITADVTDIAVDVSPQLEPKQPEIATEIEVVVTGSPEEAGGEPAAPTETAAEDTAGDVESVTASVTADEESAKPVPVEGPKPEWKVMAEKIYAERQAKRDALFEQRKKLEEARSAEREQQQQKLQQKKERTEAEMRETLRQERMEKQEAFQETLARIREEHERKRREREAMDAKLRKGEPLTPPSTTQKNAPPPSKKSDLDSRVSRLSKKEKPEGDDDK